MRLLFATAQAILSEWQPRETAYLSGSPYLTLAHHTSLAHQLSGSLACTWGRAHATAQAILPGKAMKSHKPLGFLSKEAKGGTGSLPWCGAVPLASRIAPFLEQFGGKSCIAMPQECNMIGGHDSNGTPGKRCPLLLHPTFTPKTHL